jgi:hypothetical protein
MVVLNTTGSLEIGCFLSIKKYNLVPLSHYGSLGLIGFVVNNVTQE